MNKAVIVFGIAAIILTSCATQKPHGDCTIDKYGETVCVQVYARGE